MGPAAHGCSVAGLKVAVLALGYHNTAQTGRRKNTRGLHFTDGIAEAEGYDADFVVKHFIGGLEMSDGFDGSALAG